MARCSTTSATDHRSGAGLKLHSAWESSWVASMMFLFVVSRYFNPRSRSAVESASACARPTTTNERQRRPTDRAEFTSCLLGGNALIAALIPKTGPNRSGILADRSRPSGADRHSLECYFGGAPLALCDSWGRAECRRFTGCGGLIAG